MTGEKEQDISWGAGWVALAAIFVAVLCLYNEVRTLRMDYEKVHMLPDGSGEHK